MREPSTASSPSWPALEGEHGRAGSALPRAARTPPRAAARARDRGGRGGEDPAPTAWPRDAHRRLRQPPRGILPLMEVWPGRPFPLGATWDGEGTNFALFSEHAERVELCLFDDEGREERLDLVERTALNSHGHVPGVRPGQRYGFRVHGAYDPGSERRFNPSKLLIDPYAKAIDGTVEWDAANVLPYVPSGADDADLEPDNEDDSIA